MELNDLDRQRLHRSALIGAGLWSAVFLAFLLVPLRSSLPAVHEFETVRLTLTAPPAAASVSVAAPAKPADEPAAKPAKAPAAKTARITKAAAAKKSAAGATAKSTASAGLGIPNFSAPLTSSNRTEGQSETLDFTSTAQTAKPKTAGTAAAPVAEFEGTAAQIQKPLGGGTAVTGKKTGAQASSGSADASADTSRSLSQIAGTARTGTDGTAMPGNTAGTAAGTAAGAAGRTSTVSGLDFDGIPRKLLYPAVPSITLPANLARLVDSDRTVTVQFTVRPDGSVPGGLVFFTPSAIIPAEIRDYLKAEFARWRFEESTQDGQVRFLYSIRVE